MPFTRLFSMACVIVLFCCSLVAADDYKVDLVRAGAEADWRFTQPNARIDKGELILDGRRMMTHAFYLPREWGDVRVRAKFLVEPMSDGVLACGFMVRAVDGVTHYDVHYDRAQAILVRGSDNDPWIELKREGGLKKPAGEWHEAELQAEGDALRVFLNGKQLYEVHDSSLKRGRIGFYANQGIAHVKDIVVVGKAEQPQKSLVIPAPKVGIVCSDGGAGAYEAFPDVCRLNDGRLMSVFYAGYDHVSLPTEKWPRGGRVAYCTSSDEGRTWSAAKTLFDGPDDDRDPSIVQLPDNRLLCNFFVLARSPDAKKPFIGKGTWIIESKDGGQTWGVARHIYDDYYCSSPIRPIKGGRLILPLYAERDKVSLGAIGISDDNGKTWKPPIDIDNGGHHLDAETDVIELTDGTLYAAQRPTMCFSVSKDRGSTWSVSKPMEFEGHCPYFLRTSDGIILLAHRLPNTSLHYSLDECRTWSANVPIASHIGAYPSMVNLKDGSVLVIYYEEGGGSNICYRKFRATKSGIEWLDL